MNYLQQYGWTIKSTNKTEHITLHLAEEQLTNYEANNLTFFRAFNEQQVTRTHYVLKEKEIDGTTLEAYLFERDGEIIGGHGVLPSWTPGVFNLADKGRLIEEDIIRNQ